MTTNDHKSNTINVGKFTQCPPLNIPYATTQSGSVGSNFVYPINEKNAKKRELRGQIVTLVRICDNLSRIDKEKIYNILQSRNITIGGWGNIYRFWAVKVTEDGNYITKDENYITKDGNLIQ
jgi:hypothetical protein